VQLVAKGPNDEVDRFLEAIAEAMPENIRDVQITRLAAVGEFSAFEIAF
jgi:acylphosphatase